ncbi:hypothetical protein GCWU000325_02299 [Alloprevotella tannerae ATCC 51259]|uniref:Uncharacterized protein n=1 Tax=Alloprevotella tannerae ATCC 51259 TaxID=626522 RepID=C9LJ87_9BACT|nr:hypothetical protein GCWU000325_02299 [Alloprevotella tannerae ATCC 51259]
MPYLDQQSEDTWQKCLFDKLKNVEDKLDRLLVLREQEIDTTVHPPLKPEYLDIIDVSKILKVEQKTIYKRPLHSDWCVFCLLIHCIIGSYFVYLSIKNSIILLPWHTNPRIPMSM